MALKDSKSEKGNFTGRVTCEAPREGSPFPIAGIGASAGGLKAVAQLLGQFPGNTRAAFVVVQHLEPRRKSVLTRLLSEITGMPVAEAAEGTVVRPGHIYVTPSGCDITIARGALNLAPRGEGVGPHLPIDRFLDSLAEDQQDRAIGVILSGTGSDGTRGIAGIKAVGGLTFAQAPRSSSHRGMPESAIAGGAVDFVLPPEEIARALIRVNGHLGPAAPAEMDHALLSETDKALIRIRDLLKKATGIDFTAYRESALKRKILRRMLLYQLVSLADYVKCIEDDPSEIRVIFPDILDTETRFFRDPETFASLTGEVFPAIHRGRPPEAPIRIWVAGCGTGEEVYSLAMALLEYQGEMQNRPAFQIIASDINGVALERARAGVFPESIASEVSQDRLARFFIRENRIYRIGKAIRDVCVFAKHDMTSDPPFIRMDFISCRNVLKDMSPAMRETMLSTFHYSLAPDGFLFLGIAEGADPSPGLFRRMEDGKGIYARNRKGSRMLPHVFAKSHSQELWKRKSRHRPATYLDFEQTADRLLARRFAPPGVMVNRELDILQFRGRTAPFLDLPQNASGFKLVNMVQENLFMQMRTAIREADEKGVAVRRQGIRIGERDKVRVVDIEVIPIKGADSPDSGFLILFGESADTPHPAEAPRVPIRKTDESDMLQLELLAARDYLHSLREQYDASNESLQSSNEELLSSNEELLTTIQELTAAKEQTELANEKLISMNEVLNNRNRKPDHPKPE
jgi:two-component system, chemotaxis family, CheB/CheR fusion protein